MHINLLKLLYRTLLPGYSKNDIFDNVTITSRQGQHYVVIHANTWKFSNILVKWSLMMIRAKIYENIFKFVKVMLI